MFLTKSNAFIIGPVAVLLGYIMNGIFWAQSQIGLENIGLCIILFTVVIYLFMMPLTVQQQRFSKLQAKMQPELMAIQKKYKGKTGDQAAMMKQNEETQALYEKYGVNPMGSCLQLVIQMPILFALYRVIWNIPAYVDIVKQAFMPLAEKLVGTAGAQEYLSEVAGSLRVSFPEEITNLSVIDVLYKFKPDNWAALMEKFPDMKDLISSTQGNIDRMNNFLGMNIADAPVNIITTAAKSGAILLLIGAVLIPVLAAVTQFLNAKLMSTMSDNSAMGNDGSNVANTMKTMNTVMPIMSAVFCLTLPVGMGIYWIAGAVVRSVQQIIINRHLDKVGMDAYIEKKKEKAKAKREKKGLTSEKMTQNAQLNTRSISAAKEKSAKEELSSKAGKIKDTSTDLSGAKPGSLASKAGMVAKYNETHTKK